MARALPTPPDLAKLLGTYVASCGSHYRALWQSGALHLARTRKGGDEETPFEQSPDEMRRQIRWGSFTRID